MGRIEVEFASRGILTELRPNRTIVGFEHFLALRSIKNERDLIATYYRHAVGISCRLFQEVCRHGSGLAIIDEDMSGPFKLLDKVLLCSDVNSEVLSHRILSVNLNLGSVWKIDVVPVSFAAQMRKTKLNA